jgi:hypothetical protein
MAEKDKGFLVGVGYLITVGFLLKFRFEPVYFFLVVLALYSIIYFSLTLFKGEKILTRLLYGLGTTTLVFLVLWILALIK